MHLARRKNQRAIRSEQLSPAVDRNLATPLENADDLLAFVVVQRSRRSGRERLFPCLGRIGSLGLARDRLMLETGQRVDRDGGV